MLYSGNIFATDIYAEKFDELKTTMESSQENSN